MGPTSETNPSSRDYHLLPKYCTYILNSQGPLPWLQGRRLPCGRRKVRDSNYLHVLAAAKRGLPPIQRLRSLTLKAIAQSIAHCRGHNICAERRKIGPFCCANRPSARPIVRLIPTLSSRHEGNIRAEDSL